MADIFTIWNFVFFLLVVDFLFLFICFSNVMDSRDGSKWLGVFPLVALFPTKLHGPFGRKWLYLFYLSCVILGVLAYTLIYIENNY